jgi:hypothetical protein
MTRVGSHHLYTLSNQKVVFLTYHYCSEGPANSPGVTMERMLGSGEVLAKMIDSVAQYTAGVRIKSPHGRE